MAGICPRTYPLNKEGAALALAERIRLDPINVLQGALYAALRTGAIPTTPAKLARFVCIAILSATNPKGQSNV